jgi:cell division protein FtsB
MLTWCGILFFLGILAFLDSIFNMGDIFRRVNSVLFLLISLGLLVRTTTKMKSKKIEHYENRIFSLEQQVKTLKEGKEKLAEF